MFLGEIYFSFVLLATTFTSGPSKKNSFLEKMNFVNHLMISFVYWKKALSMSYQGSYESWKTWKTWKICWFLLKSGKSHGIILENGKSHGKVMEFIPWFHGGQFKGKSSNLRQVKLPELTMGTICVIALSLVCYIVWNWLSPWVWSWKIHGKYGKSHGKVLESMSKIPVWTLAIHVLEKALSRSNSCIGKGTNS